MCKIRKKYGISQKIIFIALLLSCFIYAQKQYSPVIKGIVTDENMNPAPRSIIKVILYGTGQVISSTGTDSQGFFITENLPMVEKYHLYIEPYVSSGYPGQYYDQKINTKNPPQMPIYLFEESVFNVHIVLTMYPSEVWNPVDNYFGAIEGRVITETGAPLPNVLVVAEEPSGQNPVDETVTNDQGIFILYHVPSNCPHNLKFTPESNTGLPPQYLAEYGTTINPVYMIEVEEFNTWFLSEVALTQDPDTGIVDTTYNAMVKIWLLDSLNNELLTNGYIALFSDWGHVMSATFDANTVTMPIEFYPVPSGNHSIFIEVDNYPRQYYNPKGNTTGDFYKFYISENQTLEFDVRLTMNPSDSNATPNIFGSVKNSYGEPIAKAKVSAIDMTDFEGDYWINLPDFWADYSVETDENGTFAFYNMEPGGYALIAQKETENYIAVIYPHALSFLEAEIIIITGSNDTKYADFKLERGAEVIGWVKDENNLNGIGDIRVNLWSHMETGTFTNINYESRTDSDGRFVYKGIPKGTWYPDVWDEDGFYYRSDDEFEEVEIFGPTSVTFQKYILMKAGGALHGTYSFPGSDTLDHHGFARIFIYPEDLSLMDNDDDTLNDEWKHMYINIHVSDTPGVYRTNPIPAGNWRMVIAPYSTYDIYESRQGKYFFPSLKWMYIDKASSLENSAPIEILPYKSTDKNLKLESGGYTLIAKISSENNDLFGFDTVTNTWGKYFSVQTYVKENGRLIKIGESYDAKNNMFLVTGLVHGQQYYFESWADGYPGQWQRFSTDTSTCNEDNAEPYTFDTINFTPLEIYLIEKPEDWEEWEHGPSYLKNFKLKPAGLTSFHLSWSPSPPDENVDRYKIYRLKNATEDLFELDEDGEWWDITDDIDEDSLFELIDTFIVTDTFLIDTAASPFIQYIYVVTAIDVKGHEGRPLPGHIPLSAYFSKITYNSFTKTAQVKPETWQMVGICGLDSLKLGITDNISGVLETYRWDEKADSSKLYSHYVPVSSINPGQGIWIFSSINKYLEMTENAFYKLTNDKNSIYVKLNEGWNQISSPFPYAVSPSWLDQGFESYEWIPEQNGYKATQTFKPWKGHWVYSDKETVLPISPTPSIARKKVLSRFTRNAGWQLAVSLTGENSSDPDNFIGTLPKELIKTISGSSPEPPQAFGYPHLYFVNGTKKLAKQYVFSSVIPDKKLEWKIAISPSDETMSVVVHDLSSIPDEVSVFWIDNSGTINLRKNHTVSIDPHSETQYGYIVATANPADIALFSGKFMLRPNFPNPFNRATTLEFTIPYIWNKNGSKTEGERQKISLSVYNVSGQLVATVFSGYAKVGRHKKVWNGKSNSGRILPSGMYIARMQSADFSKSIRMFKVK